MNSSIEARVQILVVEDDVSTAALVSKWLLRGGWVPRVTPTIDEAIALLMFEPYALVLLDYMLENEKSWFVLETARSLKRPVPVIIVTGSGNERVAVEALRRGAADYIIKDENYWKCLPEIIARVIKAEPPNQNDELSACEVSDDEFVSHLRRLGLVTYKQLEAARKIRADRATHGIDFSLVDVLQAQGVLSLELRESIEKRVLSDRKGSVKQLDKFKLVRKLGEGGMGVVYLAWDVQNERNVALKILSKKHTRPDFVERFHRETKATAKLSHVNIVSAYGTGENQGYHYFAMEYCMGEPLNSKLDREKSIPWDQAFEIAIQITCGLQHAHENGIVHRDIKPSNILAGTNGVIKILDMGLSKDLSGPEQSFNTQSGVVLGTPQYMSPEQTRGEKDFDGRSDIYSLGATLYHLVTGVAPYDGPTPAVIMMKHLSDPLPPLREGHPEIPERAARVIERMMAKEPGDRYRDCRELRSALELVVHGSGSRPTGRDAGKSTRNAVQQNDEKSTTVEKIQAFFQRQSNPPSNGTAQKKIGARTKIFFSGLSVLTAAAISTALHANRVNGKTEREYKVAPAAAPQDQEPRSIPTETAALQPAGEIISLAPDAPKPVKSQVSTLQELSERFSEKPNELAHRKN